MYKTSDAKNNNIFEAAGTAVESKDCLKSVRNALFADALGKKGLLLK